MAANKPAFVIVHHSAVSYDKNPNQFAAINQYHKDKGWGMIGYHYLIEKDGSVKAGRAETMEGAHTSQQSMNFRSIGICLTGDFDQELPTDEQVAALHKLIKDVQARHHIPDANVLPHRHYATYKSCWGNKLPDNVLQYLEERLDIVPETPPEEKPSDYAVPAFAAADKYGYSANDPLGVVSPERWYQILAKHPRYGQFLGKPERALSYQDVITMMFKAGDFTL